MTYIDPADLRPGTALWPDVVLTEQDVRFETVGADEDALLTAEIARQSEEFDRVTGDHFELVENEDVTLDGSGSFVLPVHRRIVDLASVTLIDREGTETVLDASSYRAGPHYLLRVDGLVWPRTHTVRIDDLDYGWATTPGPVQRAIALLVYDVMKSQASGRHQAERWIAGDTVFERAESKPFGIPEVDRIARRYSLRHPHIAAV